MVQRGPSTTDSLANNMRQQDDFQFTSQPIKPYPKTGPVSVNGPFGLQSVGWAYWLGRRKGKPSSGEIGKSEFF